MNNETLTLEKLENIERSDAVAIRLKARLVPAGGDGSKIYPPTYTNKEGTISTYATESRLINGKEQKIVLLDSRQSQNNRMELAILKARQNKEIKHPEIRVEPLDQDKEKGFKSMDVMEAPHRIFDTNITSTTIDGTPFRQSDIMKLILSPPPKSNSYLYKYAPFMLIFGGWDSHKALCASGIKIPRVITSEIVGHNEVLGCKTKSRLDLHNFSNKENVFISKNTEDKYWTLNENEALRTENKTKKLKPSEIGLGNLPPTIDEKTGGVTIEYAEQIVVINLIGIRKYEFIEKTDGSLIEESKICETAHAIRTALIALALFGISSIDHDLRSGTLLVNDGEPIFEIISRYNQTTESFFLLKENAKQIYDEARLKAEKYGFEMESNPILLTPMPDLVELYHRSNKINSDDNNN